MDQEAEREREIGFARAVEDRLRSAVFLYGEVVFGEIPDDLAVLVANGSKNIDYLDAGGKRGIFLCVDETRGGQQSGGRRQYVAARNDVSVSFIATVSNSDVRGGRAVSPHFAGLAWLRRPVRR